ncbi:Gata transcription factor [Thalictrum thalictroides]|uniref:GATA transcription factor n=1 Tax=Thalictrum thalictroides TaxID=46969 RepID=A0A7J6UWI7_THATH|nr:Gata transcription factor [Thalictrum thalictroides]
MGKYNKNVFYFRLQTDDVEQLEWLSHFVEDSFTEYSLLPYPEENPLGKILNPKQKPLSEPETLLKESETETSIIPFVAKGRSKRIKRRVQHFPHQLWSLGSSETSNSSSSGSTSSASSGSSSSCLIFNNTTPNHELLYLFDEQPTKKKPKRVSSSEISGAQIQRRCSHCGVQKTPQWRAGPLGAKTLCNACGVRFKSGRLYPEYRPALSPTFSSEVHSNSHRKVLEMRRKKESELAPPVQSF